MSALKPMVGFSSASSSPFGGAKAPAISAGRRAAGIPIGLDGCGGASKPATFFSKSSERETLIVMLLSLMINSFYVEWIGYTGAVNIPTSFFFRELKYYRGAR